MNKDTMNYPPLAVERSLQLAVHNKVDFYGFANSVDNLDRDLQKLDVKSAEERAKFWLSLAEKIEGRLPKDWQPLS